MPYRKIAEEALAEWRDADRRLSNMTPDDPDWQSVSVLRELARARYQEAGLRARGAPARAAALRGRRGGTVGVPGMARLTGGESRSRAETEP